ncbi:MAG: response regulator [Acidobacteria bacterium]|nr:response regulator [Acidobacteriota bacterium]
MEKTEQTEQTENFSWIPFVPPFRLSVFSVISLFFPYKNMVEGIRARSTIAATSILQAFRQLRRPINVILLGDLMKPPIDGLDLIRRLRPFHIPIVVATSYGADYALLAKMAGAEVIIHKFADPSYLIRTIERAMSEHPPFPGDFELIR